MYFPFFLAYMVVGLAAAIAAFLWAVARGQFSGQERARYLPLEEEDFERPLQSSRMGRYEMCGLLLLACVGLGLSAAVLVWALVGE